MPVGFRNAAGVDFDDLFDPDVQGDGPAAPFLRTAAGVALRYAAISYGSKGPNVGYRTSAGVDVSNLWAAKGTASYVSDGGLPGGLSASVNIPAGQQGTASVSVTFGSNGTVTWSQSPGAGSGTWTAASPSSYDIRYDIVSGPTEFGQMSGTFGEWQRANANRAAGLSVTSTGAGNRAANATIRIRIRRRSDLVVVLDRQLGMSVSITTDI